MIQFDSFESPVFPHCCLSCSSLPLLSRGDIIRLLLRKNGGGGGVGVIRLTRDCFH